jgi:hypothetical protein
MGEVDDVGAEQVPAQLLAAVAEAKGRDRLAPATVLTASGYAAVFVRHALATGTDTSTYRGIANVNATTLEGLVRSLGIPLLASRGLRSASGSVRLEALRTEVLAGGGRLRHFAEHPRALGALERALQELQRCPPAVLESIRARSAQGDTLVMLLRAVRRRLHARGFADDFDVASAALEAVRTRKTPTNELGSLLTWHLGRCPQLEATALRHLGARSIGGGANAPANLGTFCEVRPCADTDEEVRTAVRAVLGAAEGGVALWRQAILHPPRAGYTRLIHQQLAGAGVAANGPGLRCLDRCATARALLGLLELAGSDWRRDQVTTWFTTAPVVAGPHGRPVPASRWDTLSATAGVIRGAGQWSERLARHASHHDADATEAEAMSRFVSRLVSRTTPPGGTWAEHARWAATLLDHYLDPEASTEPWPHEELVAMVQVRGLVESLGDLDQVSGGADLTSFRFAIKVLLERTDLDAREPGRGGFADGVFVAPFGASRGLRFHQVVVCGLADALVPGPGVVDPLLGEDIRLSDTSGALSTRATRHEELRDDLGHAVRAGNSRRVATLPICDPRTGRSHFPSRWLRDLAPSGTPWRSVESFAAGIAGPGPALSGTELELRTLERWVSCGGKAARSPVTQVNSRLAAGYEAITSRAASEFTRFDGSVGAGMVSPFDPNTPVSATRFETYAHCPRHYLLERALRVSRRVLPEELWRIEPVERGSLVHAILEQYVAERVAGAQRSLERLLAIAGDHLDEAEAGGLVGKRLLWQMDRAAILQELRRFHSEEGDLRPLSVESAFGIEDTDVPPVTILLEDGREIRFRGSADRVDETPSGHLVVTDYKTGKQSRLRALLCDPVAAGTLLQLPLYGIAARARFRTGSNDPVHARYWLLSSERSAPCYHLVVTEQVEERFRQVIGRIASGVDAGCFPGIPGPGLYDGRFKNCATCDFDTVCPPGRERQWNRKHSDPKLGPVIELLYDKVPVSLAGAVVKGFIDPDEQLEEHRGHLRTFEEQV